MKHAVKKYNKLIAFVLALALMVSMIPMGIALANDEAYPIVVDQSFSGTAGTLVDYDAAGYTAADLATYATLAEAMTALGTKGGKVWIKGTYASNNSSELAGAEGRGLVTIAGFNDTQSGNMYQLLTAGSNDNNNGKYEISLKGDLTFENIELKFYASYNNNYYMNASYGFYSYGYKLTFGEGLKMNNAGTRIGARVNSSVNNPNAQFINDIDIKSGNYYAVAPSFYQYCNNVYQHKSGSIRYGIYGGTISYLFTQPSIGCDSATYPEAASFSGDYIVDIYGGKIERLYIGTYVSNYMKNLSSIRGNTIINLQEGNVSKITVGHHQVSGTPGGYYHAPGNMVVIVNGKKSTATTVVANQYASYLALPETKAMVVIINNAEGGKATVDTTSNEYFEGVLDYNIKVTNGKAEPVYDNSKNITGFKVTPDAEGYPIYIDGELATPVEGTTDVYAIEAKGTEVIDINVDIDYTVVLGAADTEVTANEKLFTDFATAAAYLGAEGGTIYVKGAEVSVDNLAAASAHKEITVVGYNNDYSNKIKITGASTIKGNITFKNITVSGTNNWATGTNTITFGEGTRGTVSSRGAANLVFDSEYIKTTEMTLLSSSTTGNYSVTLNKGEFAGTPSIMIGSYANYPSSYYLNGNYTLTVNGGKIGVLYFAYQGTNAPGYKNVTTGVKGNTIIRLNGGVIDNFSIAQHGATSVLGKMHNIAVIADMQGENDSVNILTYNHLGKYIERYNENSKWIIIRNHAATNKASTSNATIYMDYAIDMFGGAIEPVFSEATGGDASTSVLLGFKITPDAENAGKNVLANEKFLTPNSDGLYDLSEFEASGLIRVGFEAEETKDYSQFMSLGNDLNNSYKKLINPDATVNVVYVGGSVTIGDGVAYNDRFTCWRERTGVWLKNSFPATVKNINRAGSGSGTNFGLYRNYHDIISADPDLLFIEFAINDGYDGTSAEIAKSQLETMIREIKLAKPDCDIVIILTTDKGKIVDAMNGKLHAQAEAHEAVAKAYGIPVVYVGKSLGAELDPAVKTDAQLLETEWAKYISDYCHPNAAGYDVYFRTIRAFLNTVYSGRYVAENKVVDVTDDSTIISNKLADGNKTLITGDMTTTAESAGKAHTVDTTKTLANVSTTGFVFKNEAHTGWELKYNGYLNLVNGTEGTITYTFSGTEFILFGNFIEKDAIYFTVDGGEEQTYTFGANNRYPTKLVKDAEPGEHTITVRFDWATLSNADELHVYAVGYRDDSVATGREKKEVITDASVIADYINGKIPVKEGYLFGGFMSEDGKALKADEIANAESLTVKFIPKAVLDIGWQIRQEGNTVDLRLISTVDSLEYSAVTFIVKVAGRDDMVLTSKKVYTKIAGYEDGENVQYAPTAFSVASEYFMTHVITGIPADFHGTDFTVTANLLTKDGKTITGDAITFQIDDHADYTAIVE